MATTMAEDREGDIIVPEGGQFDNFLRNPILAWAHDYSAIPIGTVTQLMVEPGKGIRAAWRWNEGDPFAERVRRAWDQGIIRSASIGFRPLKVSPGDRGLVLESWELIELSLCPIPMNSEATRVFKGLLAETPTLADVVADRTRQKRGRVLSRVNETRLRSALDQITQILSEMGPDAGDDEHQPHSDMPMPDMHEMVTCAEPSDVLAFSDDLMMLAADDADRIAVEPDEVASMVGRVVRNTLLTTVGESVRESVAREVAAATGRVM